MKAELREKIIAYNKSVAESREKADDLMTLLAALPPGQVKNLLKNETCGAILKNMDWKESKSGHH